MPTPFYHLSIAQTILSTGIQPSIDDLIRKQSGAFVLGNTAPDVQVISRKSRQETHFFKLPLDPQAQYPWEVMNRRYPFLEKYSLDSQQGAFLLGYICHLLADFLWVQSIFHPLFGPYQDWDSFPHRLYLHNVLRAYLDAQILPTLENDLIEQLQNVTPKDWLPFVKDDHLLIWRDFLCQQLIPGSESQTVEVFAARQGLPTHDFYELLSSEERMEAEIFSRVSRARLSTYYQQTIDESRKLIESHLDKSGRICTPIIEKSVQAGSVIGRLP